MLKFNKILFKCDEDLECISNVYIPLRDSITLQIIKTPVRGVNCQHFDCFDKEVFEMSCDEGSVPYCPICKRLSYKLIIDEFFATIIKESNDAAKAKHTDSSLDFQYN